MRTTVLLRVICGPGAAPVEGRAADAIATEAGRYADGLRAYRDQGEVRHRATPFWQLR